MKMRKTAGTVVMALTALLTVYFSAVMIHRISSVVLKGSYVIGKFRHISRSF